MRLAGTIFTTFRPRHPNDFNAYFAVLICFAENFSVMNIIIHVPFCWKGSLIISGRYSLEYTELH